MSKKNLSHKKKDINKVEEPLEIYQQSTNFNQSIIGYDAFGNLINQNEFIDDIEKALQDIKDGKLKMKSVSEIRK